MKPIYKWYAVVLLFVIAWSLADKGIELWALGTEVDGAGIGVYFWVFEINDRVAEMYIPYYALGFFIATLIVLISAICLAIIVSRQSNKDATLS